MSDKCYFCNQKAVLTIVCGDGLKLTLCQSCFESEYGGEDIEWQH